MVKHFKRGVQAVVPRHLLYKWLLNATFILFIFPPRVAASHKNCEDITTDKTVTISIHVPQNTSCGLTYTDLMGNQGIVTFNGRTDKDAIITQSIRLEFPTAFVWGFMQGRDKKPGLFLTRYTILAKPGDKINLLLNDKMHLSSASGQPSALIADNNAPFYTQQFGDGRPKLGEKDSRAVYTEFNNGYYRRLETAYQQEVDRLNNLKDKGQLSEASHSAALLYAKVFFYNNLFILVDESGRYPETVLPLVQNRLADIEQLLKDPNVVVSNELLRMMTGFVKTKLMVKQTTDWNNFLNLYEEGVNSDLGAFKATFLTYCLSGYPAKQVASFKSKVEDFNKRYPESAYSRYINSLVQKSAKRIDLPVKERFTTQDGQVLSMNDIVKKAATPFVVIDFWASWCGPCIAQFSILDSLKKEFKEMDLPVTFMTINLNAKKEDWLGKAKENIQYLQYNDYHLEDPKNSSFVKAINIDFIPYTIVLKDGKIIANNFTLPAELSFKKDLMALIAEQQTVTPLYTKQ